MGTHLPTCASTPTCRGDALANLRIAPDLPWGRTCQLAHRPRRSARPCPPPPPLVIWSHDQSIRTRLWHPAPPSRPVGPRPPRSILGPPRRGSLPRPLRARGTPRSRPSPRTVHGARALRGSRGLLAASERRVDPPHVRRSRPHRAQSVARRKAVGLPLHAEQALHSSAQGHASSTAPALGGELRQRPEAQVGKCVPTASWQVRPHGKLGRWGQRPKWRRMPATASQRRGPPAQRPSRGV